MLRDVPVSLSRRFVLALACVAAVCLTASAAAPPSAQAAPYQTVSGPADGPAAVLVLHGGGWYSVGADDTDQMADSWGPQFADRYLTTSTDYRPGAASVTDALAAYDALRAQVGSATPICVMGTSAGGHLALMIAARRDVACVVAVAPPTDLTAAQSSPLLSRLAQAAFGYDPAVLAANSPALLTGSIHADVLLAHEDADTLVPVGQADAFAARYPATTRVDLPYGDDEGFGHSMTTHAAANAFRAQMRAFVDASVARWAAAHCPTPAATSAPASAPAPAATQSTAAVAKPAKAKRRQAHKRTSRATDRRH
jgi:acetyl esterase/lipase